MFGEREEASAVVLSSTCSARASEREKRHTTAGGDSEAACANGWSFSVDSVWTTWLLTQTIECQLCGHEQNKWTSSLRCELDGDGDGAPGPATAAEIGLCVVSECARRLVEPIGVAFASHGALRGCKPLTRVDCEGEGDVSSAAKSFGRRATHARREPSWCRA